MTNPIDTPLSVEHADISLAGAGVVLDAAIDAAAAMGVAVCLVVCDAGGNVVASARMDGAPILSLQIATDKAWTVAAFNGVPTSAWWGMIESEPSLVHGITHTPRLVVFGGGEALRIDGRLVGAIGISGGSSEQDAELAIAGANALLDG